MGASASAMRGDRTASSNSRRIDRALSKEKSDQSSRFKILLLGGSECGKTTIFKQMRILHLNGFNQEQIAEYRDLIHVNAIEALAQLVRACDQFKYKHDISIQEDIQRFTEYRKTLMNEDRPAITLTIARCMERIWNSTPVQASFVRRFQFQLLDSAQHFLDNISRIGDPEYVPTTQDILLCRYRTVGISELNFLYKKIDFQMVDVGGQRTERRKWIHCFDNADMILFVVAMSDYDLQDPEDAKQNRMLQNYEIFKTIASSDLFKTASIVLFLNKYDIFKEKLRSVPLSKCWPNYRGDNSEEDATAYMKKVFGRCIQQKHKFFVFTTKATDTDNIERVFSSAVAHIVNQNLRSTGLHE